uniref:Sulfotransferase n=1 Tax=Pseudonaja textilis TaxID=8673 RepID=A0A670ZNQ1_PSETE
MEQGDACLDVSDIELATPKKLNEKLLLAEFPYLEIGDTEKYKRMDTYPSRRVIYIHIYVLPWGSYIEYLCTWNKYIDNENVLPITYEEIKENSALGAKKISTFFELNLNEEDFQGVAERSTFKVMKEKSKTTHGEAGEALFRKGGVSDWKTLFSEANNKEMDTVFKERLEGTKVGKLINYDHYCKA